MFSVFLFSLFTKIETCILLSFVSNQLELKFYSYVKKRLQIFFRTKYLILFSLVYPTVDSTTSYEETKTS